MTDPQWSVEQVAALAPSPATFAAADDLGEPRRWHGCGSAAGVQWGRYIGARSEPYDTSVDTGAAEHADGVPRFRCTCPSRVRPCKHALGLMLLWLRGHVPEVSDTAIPRPVSAWIEARPAVGSAPAATAPTTDEASSDRSDDGASGIPSPPPSGDRAGERNERVARMRAGLGELARWLEDRMRTGLSDPALARYSTWDDLAARLVDAQLGALANRVRRLAGLVGASPGWHEQLLTELGVLHLLVRAAQHLPELPAELADGVATAVGWQVRHADVLAGVPDTDVWQVMGRSDRREDRIEVRRTWLCGKRSERWAMVLSFAAYQQSLDTSLPVGTALHADVHRFPGSGLRALVGRRHAAPRPGPTPSGLTVDRAAHAVGLIVLGEPWTERVPVTVAAALTNVHGRWMLTDASGSLSCATSDRTLASVLAATGGRPAPITVEWTPAGLVPLTVHLPDRHLDVGPRADRSFVSAA